MKIGLLTYYRSNVFGGYWQSLSHLESLSYYFPGSQVYILPALHATRYSKLRGLSKRPHLLADSFIRYVKYSRLRKKSYSPYYLPGLLDLWDLAQLEDYSKVHKLDLLITGADTCLDMSPEDALTGDMTIYWSQSNPTMQRAYISSSCGDLDYSMLSDEAKRNLSKSIQTASYVGLRDQMTIDLFRKLGYSENLIMFNPDPAFWGFNRYLPGLISPDIPSPDSPLCLISLTSSTIDINIILRLLKCYRILNVNIPSVPGCKTLFPGPNGHAKLISQSSLLITSSFHETICAASLGIPFVAIERLSSQTKSFGMTKLSDLCKCLGCVNQYINPLNLLSHGVANLDDAVFHAIDHARIHANETMQEAKKMSLLFEKAMIDFVDIFS